MPDSRIRLITTTFESRSQARQLADELIDDRLAACVTIDGPHTSIYCWDGERVEEDEWTLVAKSRKEREDDVIAFIENHHPYDCPEVLVEDVDAASSDYEQWVQEQVR